MSRKPYSDNQITELTQNSKMSIFDKLMSARGRAAGIARHRNELQKQVDSLKEKIDTVIEHGTRYYDGYHDMKVALRNAEDDVQSLVSKNARYRDDIFRLEDSLRTYKGWAITTTALLVVGVITAIVWGSCSEMLGIKRESPMAAARRLSRKTVITEASKNFVYYRVKDYTVVFNPRSIDRPWSCTCEHGSMYGVNKPDEHCKHIWAVRIRARREGILVWEEPDGKKERP